MTQGRCRGIKNILYIVLQTMSVCDTIYNIIELKGVEKHV